MRSWPRRSPRSADALTDQPNVGEIVGVARQVKRRPDEPKDFVQIYVPMAHDLSDDVVVGDAIKVIAIGAVIGLVLSAMLGRMIVSMLFGVQPLDATTFALVIGVLSLTAAVAVAGPAWRAARIDPAQALRSK